MSKNIQGTGNIFTHEIGEHAKSIWVYDTETKEIEEVPLPVRGVYKTIWEEKDAKEAIPSHSIVKCYVTDRRTSLDDVKAFLQFFDASIFVEQYPSERQKVHFAEGALDLSTDNLLRLYAETKDIPYADLKNGLELIT